MTLILDMAEVRNNRCVVTGTADLNVLNVLLISNINQQR